MIAWKRQEGVRWRLGPVCAGRKGSRNASRLRRQQGTRSAVSSLGAARADAAKGAVHAWLCTGADTERVLVGRPLTPGAGTGRVTSNLPIQHLHSRRPFSIAAYIRIMIPSLEKCAA